MHTVKVSEFTFFPGPRYRRLGKNSGEEFREDVLMPDIEEHKKIQLDLDGVLGYGSSFLEEAFGGLIRSDVDPELVRFMVNNAISNDNPTIKEEIISYVEDAIKAKDNQALAHARGANS
ncbi:STAS-like domain-containing protein [Alteromonas sp. CYL-A6]|uniref:STAS-like domain-containing protein n=1 Tax=Alteromonas nitratireducens TaxID=3390813 RepID=UPI0034C093B2